MITRSESMPEELKAIFLSQIERCSSSSELRALLSDIARLPGTDDLVAICNDQLDLLALFEGIERRPN